MPAPPAPHAHTKPLASPHPPRMPRAARTYHHGDLRRALLDAALQIVRREGMAALTLRAVARRAGVSHQAPYNHFADRDALVAAVAQEGFERLAAALAKARADAGADNPVGQLQEGGVCYVVFAVEHPALFRVMFGPELADRSTHPELSRAARAVFNDLLAPAGTLLARPLSGGDAVGVTLWAAVHGLAMLLIDNQVPPPADASAPRAAVRRTRRAGGATANAASADDARTLVTPAAARQLALSVTERLWFGMQPLVG